MFYRGQNIPYIVDAKIYVHSTDSSNQEVELIIVTQDQFSIGLTPNISSANKFALRVFDKNAFGTGSEISYSLIYEKDTVPEYGTNLFYSINNIGGTFTNARISYTNTPSKEAFILEADKQFITPQTKLGGGIFASKKSDHWFIINTDTSLFIPYSGAFVDVWAGYSPQLFTPKSRKQLVIAGRYDYESYLKKPLVDADSNQQFANSKLLLAALSFRKINYIKSKLLVGFGRTEDVPIGQLLSITSGYKFTELGDYPYVGIGFGFSRSTPFGLIGAKFDFGGFINYDEQLLNDGAFAAKIIYYAPLHPIGRFSIRNSLKLSF